MSSFKAFNNLSPFHCLRSLCSISFRTTGCWIRFSHSHLYSSLSCSTFMEVVKAVARKGSAARNSIAIRADKKSYSFEQLVLSAQNISSLLCSVDLRSTHKCSRDENSSVLVDGIKETRSFDGARVGIVAKPSAEFVAGILGTWLSGGVAVPLALSYPEAELLHVMNDSVCP